MRALTLALIGLLALAGASFSQQGAFPNYPIVGASSYCSSYTNGVCTNTVPAGPTVLTGNEQIPANTELANGQSPQNVLITPASLGANPVTFVTVANTGNPSAISSSNLSGGVVFVGTVTITQANITLPSSPINGQQFVLSSNRTITTLVVTAASGDAIASNTNPTILTASTTISNGYRFICRLVSGVCTWSRLQ